MVSRQSRRPLSAATAVVAASAVSSVIGMSAAFSVPSATRISVTPSLAAASSTTTSCSADAYTPQNRGPQHFSCGKSFAAMSVDELLQVGDLNSRNYDSQQQEQQLVALQRGDGTLPSSRRHNTQFSSLSGGRYGGLGDNGHPRTDNFQLSVSRSSDNFLGFRVEDFEPYDPREPNDETDLHFRVEGFDNYQGEVSVKKDGRPVVRTVDPRNSSPTKKFVAASLLKNGSTTQLGRELTSRRSSRTNADRNLDDIEEEKSDVPPSFPWVPTESQINTLKVFQLRAVCAERGLIRTGKKAELQQRLLLWANIEGRKRVKDRLMGLKDLIETSKSKGGSSTLDNLEYDVDALTNKRKALRKEKRRGGSNEKGVLGLVDESYFSNTTSSSIEILIDEDEDETEDEADDYDGGSIVDEASISQLSKTFNAPASTYSNREVREMYIEAKALDQEGDREKSKEVLRKLREATPHDMRVVRRLARMEQEDGNISAARGLLQRALRGEPGNAHLLQGLGQLERQAGNDATAMNHFRQAIKANPTFANPYHALGTLEHTHGNIKAALAVIKDGLRKCPQNHRLHHALGDVYLDANMLDFAEESYLEGLQHGPEWSKAFFYTSLSFVSYAKGQVQESRTLLRQSLEINGGMHAQGVIALAQLEESEGNIHAAREVYRDAISRYERRRRKRSPFRSKSPGEEDMFDSPSLVDEDGKQYSRNYSGDKWVNVFKSWARMEEIHGTYETAHIVFSKAARLFPNSMNLLIQWADLQSDHGEDEKGRLLYEAACHRAGDGSAKPFQALAEFEMKRRNFVKAQSILYRGAQCAASSNGIADGKNGLARLFHTWGVCEYHLGNESKAQQLLEDALRVTGPGEADSTMRSLILYSMARLEVLRGEHLLAQHCIGLSLKENLFPGGNSLIWKLWAEIAEKMENKVLEKRCKEQALLRWEEERGGTVSDLSRLLGARGSDSSSRLPERTGSVMKDMFRKTPWSSKVCHTSGRMDRVWYQGANLWKL
mmetsp:Transcript_3778/g.8062  ORF Transcript_3778/g.8062 Transcript_3778/m.8062 type:complete len:1004 (+) Transcript_3778:188-3199(+)